MLGSARIGRAVLLSAVSRETNVLDGDTLSAREGIVALIDDGPGTIDDEIGGAGSNRVTSACDVVVSETLAERVVAVIGGNRRSGDGGIGGILAADGAVRGELDKDGRSGIGLEDGLDIRGGVAANVGDGPCTDDGLGADTSVSRVRVLEVKGNVARRGDGGVSGDRGLNG